MRNDYYDGPVTPVPEITEIQALLVMHTKRDGTPEDGTTRNSGKPCGTACGWSL